IHVSVEPPVPPGVFFIAPAFSLGGEVRFDLLLFLVRLRRVALEKPRGPYAKLKRPVGAKSRVLMVRWTVDSFFSRFAR
ncbi:MAG: hypothetical protein ACKO0N_03830, partial [Planctomycetota bacterium]